MIGKTVVESQKIFGTKSNSQSNTKMQQREKSN